MSTGQRSPLASTPLEVPEVLEDLGYPEDPPPPRPSFGRLREPTHPAQPPAEAWDHLVKPSSHRRAFWPALALPLALLVGGWAFVTLSPAVDELRAEESVREASPKEPTWPAIQTAPDAEDDPLEAYTPEAPPAPSELDVPLPEELEARDLDTPGALLVSYSYADSWRGWPVGSPRVQQPVRGSFLAPRTVESTYHFGVDVSVDDARPDPAAPPGTTHRVVALESGFVQLSHNGSGFTAPSCHDRRFMIGHFEYWHIKPTVELGQYVRAGEQVGWTCLGEGHIHVSEWAEVGSRRVWVNPLHSGGKLAPYTDTAKPQIGAMRFRSPEVEPWRPLSLREPDTSTLVPKDALAGLVELRVPVWDGQSHLGFLAEDPRRANGFFTPYRVAAAVRSWDRDVVFAVDSFRSDVFLERDYLDHYAPGSRKPLSMRRCLAGTTATCAGRFIYRPFSRHTRRFWDTRNVPDGRYIVSVYAWDIVGNMASRSEVVTVKNGQKGFSGPALVSGS